MKITSLRRVKTIRATNPGIRIRIAADRDLESGTGERYANKAAGMFKDVDYRMPVFKEGQEALSDFNDLMVAEGKERVREILKF